MPAKPQYKFKLRDFIGVNPDQIAKLAAAGVKTTGQILSAGQTVESRANIARQAGIPEEVVLELVKLSDLARLPGVKGIRARLYYAAGVDTVEKLAAYEPEVLLKLTAEFVKDAGFPGIPPLPKEVSSTIVNARKLPNLVEWT
jgi:predicted RecB family nuclease